MFQTDVAAARERLAVEIDEHMTALAELWAEWRSLDAKASDAAFRTALARRGLPGGLRPSEGPAMTLRDQVRRLPVYKAAA
jgi:hypothetical protein